MKVHVDITSFTWICKIFTFLANNNSGSDCHVTITGVYLGDWFPKNYTLRLKNQLWCRKPKQHNNVGLSFRVSSSCNMQFLVVKIIFLFFRVKIALSEVFTALAEMESLIKVERKLLVNLKSFVDQEDNRIQKLKGWVKLLNTREYYDLISMHFIAIWTSTRKCTLVLVATCPHT